MPFIQQILTTPNTVVGVGDIIKNIMRDFPGGPVVKSLPCNARGMGSILGWETKIPSAAKGLKSMVFRN